MASHSQNDLNKALLAHQEGRLKDAEALYRHALESTPDNADIWHLLGALSHQKGADREAEEYLNRALELLPNFPEALNTRGILLKDSGRLSKAEDDFRAALQEVPNFAQALTNLADTLRLTGAFNEAKELSEQAIQAAPDLAAAFNNLGAIERDLSHLEEACRAFEKALELDPGLIDAAINLATTLALRGEGASALRTAKRAVQKAPDYAPAQNCLGSLHFDNENIEEAHLCFKTAAALEPDYAEAHNNLANTLTRLGKLEDAQDHYDKALEKEPENPDFWANKAAAFQAQNDIAACLKACEKALKINPNHADARWNRAMARLISGDLAGGFADYQARWALPEFSRRSLPAAEWAGEDLAGKSILLHSEQGFGDTLQFIRYAALLKAQKPTAIYLETPAPLCRLLAPMAALTDVFKQGETLPKTDYHAPLLSLPYLCKTTLDTVLATLPYLYAPRDIADFPGGIDNETMTNIGLVWAGRPSHKNDRNRTLSFKSLLPLFNVNNTQFFSLQLGDAQKELSASAKVIDISGYLEDFAATAALIEPLDLIITVDTALAHLAGAMGKKCWVMLPFAPDWRWLLDRDESPWYPSLTLFRQPRPGDWATVIQHITEKLRDA